MKKRSFSSLIVLLISLLFAPYAFSQDAVVRITPSPVKSPKVGTELTVDVAIENGQNVAGYEFTLAFDTSAFTHVESSKGNYLPNPHWWGGFRVEDLPVKYRMTFRTISLTGGKGNGNGTLATFTFRVREVKASTFTLSEVKLVENGKETTPRVVNGAVTAVSDSDGDIQIPDEMVSAVAHGKNVTYFILEAKSPKVTRFPNGDADVYYGNCKITLHPPADTQLFALPRETPSQQAQPKDGAAVEFAAKLTVGVVGVGITDPVNTVITIIEMAALLQAYSDANAPVYITLEPRKPDWWNPFTWYSTPGYPNNAFSFVILLKNRNGRQIRNLEFTIEQEYKKGDNSYTSVARGKWALESAAAAPHAQPMSLADYPPFQSLPAEVQAYLLRHFGGIVNAGDWQMPEVTSLLPNYPNPFNPETWMPYQLATPADVTLTIYDVNGRVVRDLALGHQRAGIYESKSRAAYWDGRNAQGEPVASGVYFYTLKAGDFSATKKMLIRK